MKWKPIREPVRLAEPQPPETAYGKYFHCPGCGTSYVLTEAVNPLDPWHVCAFCAQIVDLRAFVRGSEHPGLTPVA